MGVEASIDERNTEGSKATMLRISLLEITQTSYQLFTGYVFVVGEKVSLGGLASVVDEDVGIGSHACDSTYHVAVTRTLVFELVKLWMLLFHTHLICRASLRKYLAPAVCLSLFSLQLVQCHLLTEYRWLCRHGR